MTSSAVRFGLGLITGAAGYGFMQTVYPNKPEIHVEYQEGVDKSKLKRAKEILKYGSPERGSDVCYYSNHVLCYDQTKKIPAWVAEHLTVDNIKGPGDRSSSDFRPDPRVSDMFTAHNSDYHRSGFSRGHMAPAADNKSSQVAMNETFYLTNILPQNYENNAGFWNRFEMYCRDLTQSFKDVRIISGPVMVPLDKDEQGKKYVKYQVVGRDEVAAPTHLYKVIVAERGQGTMPAIGAFIVPNIPIGFEKNLVDFQVSLEDLEKRAGITFHPNLNRNQTQNLCTVDGCKLMDREQFELYIIGRKLARASTLHRLDTVWKEMEKKQLNPDAYLDNLYNRKKQQFQQEQNHQRTD